jgi:hypothetical protein
MSSGFFRDEAAIAIGRFPWRPDPKQRARGIPRRRMLDTSGKEGAKFLASDASTRVRPHIDWVGVLAQNFSESVTSGKLKGSHLFASVIHASRKRA